MFSIRHLVVAVLAGCGTASVAASAHAQVNVFWRNNVVANWNVNANWTGNNGPPPAAGFVPEGTYNERAVINNSGTAFVTTVYDNSGAGKFGPGDIILGQGAADLGTLEIRSGGLLSLRSPAPPPQPVSNVNGIVTVGQSGTGALKVLSGGSLVGKGLISGGNSASSIEMSGTASTTISGTTRLGRSLRVTGPSVTFKTDNLLLEGSSIYTAAITGATHSAISVGGDATLGGTLNLEFSGGAPALGSTRTIVDAGQVLGNFNAINVVSGLTLGTGQKVYFQTVPGGTNGTLGRIVYDQVLSLTVNRNTGAVTVANPGSGAIDWDGYEVRSATGSLAPASWTSLSDQPVAGWNEAVAAPSALGEIKTTAGGTSITGSNVGNRSLGNVFSPSYVAFGVSPEDLTFTYTRPGKGVIQADVNYVGDPVYNTLVLTVDPATGQGNIRNFSPFSTAIDSFRITSTNGSLNTGAGWVGLGGDWLDANLGPNQIAQVKELGTTGFNFGTNFDLGKVMAIGGTQDLQFEFLLEGQTVALKGGVIYGAIPEGLDGDYNDNGVVDAADYTVWRDSVGQTGAGLAADGNGDSIVNDLDYGYWKSRFGNTAGSGSASATAVPEPSTGTILLLLGTVVARLPRRRFK